MPCDDYAVTLCQLDYIADRTGRYVPYFPKYGGAFLNQFNDVGADLRPRHGWVW